MLSGALDISCDFINKKLKHYTPAAIVGGTLGAVLSVKAACYAYDVYQKWDTKAVKEDVYKRTIDALTSVPILGEMIEYEIDRELGKTLRDLLEEDTKSKLGYGVYPTLPKKGLPDKEILDRLRKINDHYTAGKSSGTVYIEHDEETKKFLGEVKKSAELTNPLHSEWPLIKLMKAELISWCQNLLHGKTNSHGVITPGGTYSILEACYTYARYAKKIGKTDVEMIVPETIHVAFHKAAEMFGIKLVKVPVNAKGEADVEAIKNAINKHTCMIAASAISFPHGTLDNIPEIARIAKANDIPFVVDSCLGSMEAAMAEKAGFPLKVPYDFSVDGVTAIMFDFHKGTKVDKGGSGLLFSPDSPATPTQTYLDWIGGLYITDNMGGSSPGSYIAEAWATMARFGEEYYVEETRKILTLQKELIAELKKIKGIKIMYDPQLSVVGIQVDPNTDSKIDILLVAQKLQENTLKEENTKDEESPKVESKDQVKKKADKWSVNILQTSDQKPAGFHFCLTSVHANHKEFLTEFTQKLKSAVEYAESHPDEKPTGIAKAYGFLPYLPKFLHDRIGEGYAKIQNSIPGERIPGVTELIEMASQPSAFAPLKAVVSKITGLWSKPVAEQQPNPQQQETLGMKRA